MTITEAFGYTPELTLKSDFVLLLSMIREYNYMIKQRNEKYDKGAGDVDYIDVPDFETGGVKKVKKVKMI